MRGAVFLLLLAGVSACTEATPIFGRTWGADPNGFRKELTDTRIRGTFAEDFDLAAGGPVATIRYSIVFERVLAERAGEVTFVSSDEIASGVCARQ